jgi:hypothetical protein
MYSIVFFFFFCSPRKPSKVLGGRYYSWCLPPERKGKRGREKTRGIVGGSKESDGLPTECRFRLGERERMRFRQSSRKIEGELEDK